MEKVLIFTKNLELLLGIVMCKVGRWGPLGNIRKRTEILTQQSKTLEKIGHDYIYKPIHILYAKIVFKCCRLGNAKVFPVSSAIYFGFVFEELGQLLKLFCV